jgi:outer membrane receptor protein involved in Fe transport
MRGSWVTRAAAPLLALLLGSVATSAARAQQQGGEPGPPQSPPRLEPPPSIEDVAPPPGIEAIEVTGERLNDANVQDEAQAITAFTGADLDRANIVSVDTLAFNVPGLHVGQSAQAPIITLRGIGTENASLTGEPGVAFHVDGINLGRPAAARVAFFDLETLDVKRGPQGLLGGKNSTSGSINLITNKPTDEYEAGGDVRFGNYDRVRLRGHVNVPMAWLGEGTAARVALYRETRDGFLDNKYVSDSEDPFDADDFGLRAHFKMTPTDRLDLLFSYNYFKQDGNGPQADIVPIQRTIVPQGSIPADLLPPNTEYACADELNARPPIVFADTSSFMPATARCATRVVAQAGRIPGNYPAGRPATRRITYDRHTGVPGQVIPTTIVQTGSRQSSTLAEFQQQKAYDAATIDGDPREIYLDSNPTQHNRYWGWSTHLGWDAPALPLLGETRLELLGGFQKTIGGVKNDFDATDARISYYEADDDADQYSGELQWTGLTAAERLEWKASLFHLHEQAERNVFSPGIDDPLFGQTIDQETDNKAYGAALHGTYELTGTLRFSLGGRWIKDRKESWFERFLFQAVDPNSQFRGCTGNLGIQGPPPAPARTNEKCQLTDRETMWGTGLEWRPFGDDHLLYAKLDRGAKSGGFRAGMPGEYLPERIWAYAAGTKSEFFDQRLRVNLEGFFYSYEDLQLVIIDGLVLRTENSDARMWGWDLESQLSPIEGLNLSAVVSYLRTETIDYHSLDPATAYQVQASRLGEREDAEALYQEGIRDDTAFFETRRGCLSPKLDGSLVACNTLGDAGALDDFSGNVLSRSPRWKLTLSGDYEIPLGRFGSLIPRIQYTWQDETFFRAFNKDFEKQEPYHLTDASLTWKSPEDRWNVELFVSNIEDEAPKQNILIGPRYFGSPPLAWYGPPRFYGVQIGFKY